MAVCCLRIAAMSCHSASKFSLPPLAMQAISVILSRLELPSAVSLGLACRGMLAELRNAPLSISISAHAASLPSTDASSYVSRLTLTMSKYLPGGIQFWKFTNHPGLSCLPSFDNICDNQMLA